MYQVLSIYTHIFLQQSYETVPLLYPCYRLGDEGPEEINNLSKITY